MRISRSSKYLFTAIIFSAVCVTFLLWGHTLAARENRLPAQQSVDLVLDHTSGAVRFYVEGQEVVRIDRDGLRVRNDIEYGGTITDTGRDYYDAGAIPLSAPDHAD